jgi:3-hydroxyisobutyrate dehydrogenase
MKIGFIGLGNMGAPMARNLVKAGHDLVVYDVVEANMNKLAQANKNKVTIATSLFSLISSKVEIIITMLPTSKEVKSVYLDESGVLSQDVNGLILIDSSTIDPMSSREVSKRATDKGALMLDAPVSGGTGGAEAGSLTFMVGGELSLFNQMSFLFQAMGKNIVYCGNSGNGQVAKVANNMLLAISMIGTAEAMNLGVSLGMDPQVLAGIINSSSGRCWSSDTYNPYPGVLENTPASRGYSGGFGADLMLKDLSLATEAAKLVKLPVPMGGLAQQLYQAFNTQGNGSFDFSAIINLFKKND